MIDLAREMNQVHPVAVSVVDTFGAMYQEDLERIVQVLDCELDAGIKLGFHSHNNQQLSFALTMHFVELFKDSKRGCIVDSSLCGMGRGAGNATTELVANYLNRKQHGDYDMNQIMDAIDMYMQYFQENYTWGYSTPYFIAGMYCCHVNNIAYLLKIIERMRLICAISLNPCHRKNGENMTMICWRKISRESEPDCG